MSWIPEPVPARLDADKERLLASLPDGSVPLASGPLLPGTWWRLEEGGTIVGYGWMDVTWGDAQILLAVDAAHARSGHGARILAHLEGEAVKRGFAYMFNTIPKGHPDPDGLRAFLERHGFVASGLEKSLLRKRVRRSP